MRTLTAIMVLALAIIAVGCGRRSNEMDAALDQMEAMMDQTIAIQKKIAAGDMSAMSEMAELTEKYQSYNENLEAAKDQGMTKEQTKRYLDIMAKYQRALAEQQSQ